MKVLTTLLIAVLVGLMVYTVRRRVWLALRAGGIAYVVVLFGRLLLSAGDFGDRWDEVLWPIFGLLVVWVVLWVVSSMYQQRKSASAPRRPD